MNGATADNRLDLRRIEALLDRLDPLPRGACSLRTIGDRGVRDVVQRFVDAFENDDVDAILDLLCDDATFSMPPHAEWYRGRDAIGDSWLMPGGPPAGLRYLPTRANGQIALGVYRLDEASSTYLPIALDVLTFRGEKIVDVVAFRLPEIFPSFGLPDRIAA